MDVSASVQHLVDDVWDEDDEGAERRIAEASLKQVEQAQYAAGYQRGYDDATSSTNTKLVQHGFDDGYQLGLMLGVSMLNLSYGTQNANIPKMRSSTSSSGSTKIS